MYPGWLEARLAPDLKRPLVQILFGARQTGKTTLLADEAQAVPSVFDSVQVLYDREPRRWRFVLFGSSARNLRRRGANLLAQLVAKKSGVLFQTGRRPLLTGSRQPDRPM